MHDGSTVSGAKVKRTYERAGFYSEVLKVTDADGNVDYDFADVQIVDGKNPKALLPTVHPCYYPTFGIEPTDEVVFKVRSFRTVQGKEIWDFGDGTPKVEVQSDGNARKHDLNGYAVTTHSYEEPGYYIVTVERTNEYNAKTMARLCVRVGVDD